MIFVLIACSLAILSLYYFRTSRLHNERSASASSFSIFDAMEEGVVIFDGDGRVAFFNQAAARIASPYDILALFSPGADKREPGVIYGDGTPVGGCTPVARAIRSGEDVLGVTMGVPQPDGFHRWILTNAKLWRKGPGRGLSVLMTMTDVTHLKQQEEAIRQLAFEDAVTGLPNRRLFQDRLGQAIERSKRNGKKFAILFLDLDDFKRVNDAYGHEAGDRLLAAVARRLVGCLRGSDTVARYGGDEFVILLAEIGDAAGVAVVIDKVQRRLGAPYALADGREVVVSASIGSAVYPDDGPTSGDLLEAADRAMYASKARTSERIARSEL